MAVFICECCGATLKKQQIDKHCETKCRSAWAFTCVECTQTFEGFGYKEHNECMTEVQKYQGKFLERQRQEKMKAKADAKVDKVTNNLEEEKKSSDKKQKKSDKEGDDSASEPDQISEKEAIRLRKFLDDGCEFKGFAETAIAILKKTESKSMKIKVLTKTMQQVFKLSEEYDSDDSDIEDEHKFLTDAKKIRKQFKKLDNAKLVMDGKMVKFVK